MSARLRPDQIAASLRRAVRERVLAPGEALNQDELARRYGVSRIPVREALRTLVGEGLIVMQPGLGAVVTQLESAEVNELYGLRLALEPGLAADVVANVRPQDVAQLAETVDDMAVLDSAQSAEWSNLNYGFHRRLYELSDRRHVMRLVVQVLNLVEPYARVYAHVLGSRELLQTQRAAMVAALRARDDTRLRDLIVESIEGARAALVESMNSQPAEQTDGFLHPFPQAETKS
jgi:DNA-binding GntR family transcriptional regulator